ncbi:MAG: S8 family serine peptidase [Acidimicrobiia bacterium]|nr:S8 family serine peptidase [Acidimicrobiia bacterium]
MWEAARPGRAGRIVVAAALVAAAAICAPAGASPDDESAPARRVIVEVGAPDLSALGRVGIAMERAGVRATVDRIEDEAGGGVHVVREFEAIPHFVADVDAAGLEALEADPAVVSVVPDTPRRPLLAESIPIVEADTAWAAGWDGTGETVAVIDTGVDGTHPMLASKVVAEACFSSGGNCPGGGTAETGSGSGVPCVGCPDNVHGTHVAGIAAGNGPTLDGVARGASVFSIMAGTVVNDPVTCDGIAPCLLFYDSDMVAGLDHVYSRLGTVPVSAVNLSIGGGHFTGACDILVPAMTSAIDRLAAAGVAVVVSAGNDGYVNELSYPACISSAVSVGATTDADTRASYSNAGPELDVFAPGSLVRSSVPGGGYATLNGTSMAAPHVAGAFAVFRDADPASTPTGVLSALKATGVPISVSGGRSEPRIRVGTALDAYLSGETPKDHAKITVSGGVSYTNDADVVSGNFTVKRGFLTPLAAVTGSGQVPSASGTGQATISINLQSLAGLPLYFGNMSIHDPGAGRSLDAVLFLPSVGLAGSKASGSSTWFEMRSFPWASYRIAWSITDAA